MNNESGADGFTLAMQRGPFQNNGATPWYTTVEIGTPGQPLKMALDTGTNITWITSSLCATDHCQHFSAGRFDYQASNSFAFTDCLQHPYSFGPWGTMQVEAGSDQLTLNHLTLPTQFLLAADYSGEQFRQLGWDGGIGLPSSSAYVDGRNSFLFQALMNSGEINPRQPYVTFDWDVALQRGTCSLGSVDASKTRGPQLFLPWSVYSKVPGIEYIWSTPLASYAVGGEVLAHNISFVVDSGSSQFKGDDRLMRQTLERIARGGYPDLVLGFADGEITLGASAYNIFIEEGPQKGQTLPQFEPLDMPDLVLVGSLVMELCYTVYEYRVVQCQSGAYSLAPVGVWLFNRPDGPQIITRSSAQRFDPAPREVTKGKLVLNPAPKISAALAPGTVAGTWKNDYGSLMTLTVTGNQVSGTYQSSTGSTGKYHVTGYQLEAGPNLDQGQPVALAIEWHSLTQDPADPSWGWSSGLCGQIHGVGDKELLTLSHLLVASSDFPGLTNQGNYIDKLVYHRVADGSANAHLNLPTVSPTIDDALSGEWLGADGSRLNLSVRACGQHAFGAVSGSLSSGQSLVDVSGFTDINALTNKLVLQSVSLTAARASDSRALSLSGSLDLKSDGLHLLVLSSSPTTAANSYVQTQLTSITFTRQVNNQHPNNAKPIHLTPLDANGLHESCAYPTN